MKEKEKNFTCTCTCIECVSGNTCYGEEYIRISTTE